MTDQQQVLTQEYMRLNESLKKRGIYMIKKYFYSVFFVCLLIFTLCGSTCSECYFFHKKLNKYIWVPTLADYKYSVWMWGMASDGDFSRADEDKFTQSDEINDRDSSEQEELEKSDPVSPDVNKNTPGYVDLRAMVVSANKIQINGLVKVHGAVYANNEILMQGGAVVEEDMEFIADMRRMNMEGYTCFGTVKADGKPPAPILSKYNNTTNNRAMNPVSLDLLPLRIKLLNPQEVEVDDSVFKN